MLHDTHSGKKPMFYTHDYTRRHDCNETREGEGDDISVGLSSERNVLNWMARFAQIYTRTHARTRTHTHIRTHGRTQRTHPHAYAHARSHAPMLMRYHLGVNYKLGRTPHIVIDIRYTSPDCSLQ